VRRQRTRARGPRTSSPTGRGCRASRPRPAGAPAPSEPGPAAAPAGGNASGAPVNRAGGQWLEGSQKGTLGEPVPAARGARGKGHRGPLSRDTSTHTGSQLRAVADVACPPGTTWQGQGTGEASDSSPGVSQSFRRSNHPAPPGVPRPAPGAGAPGGAREAGEGGAREGAAGEEGAR